MFVPLLGLSMLVQFLLIGCAILGVIFIGIAAIAFAMYGNIWFQAFMSSAAGDGAT